MVSPYPERSDKISGGVFAVSKYLIDELTQIEDVDLHVITVKDGLKSNQTIHHPACTIHILATFRYPRVFCTLSWDRLKVLRKIRQLKPDIIHSQSVDYSYLASTKKMPMVTTVHGISHEEYKLVKKDARGMLRSYLWNYIEKQALKKTNNLIAISPYVVESEKHLTRAHIYYVENPVPDKFFEVKNREVSNNLLFVGLIVPRKNILTLLNALTIVKKIHPKIKLLVAGKIRDHSYFKKLEEYIVQNKLNKNVNFMGHLDEETLLDKYSTSSMLILPSIQETAPMVIEQAMAAGRPVIASNICGIPHLVRDGETGFLINPNDYDTLAQKIILLLNDEELRHQMGREAKKEAQKRFRASLVAKKTYDVYCNILKN